MLKLVVYIFKLMLLIFPYSLNNINEKTFVILMRRRHLNNTTFCVFPKRVILKRENNIVRSLLASGLLKSFVQLYTLGYKLRSHSLA